MAGTIETEDLAAVALHGLITYTGNGTDPRRMAERAFEFAEAFKAVAAERRRAREEADREART